VLLNFSLPLACYIILRKQEQRKSATLDVSPQGQLDISLPLLHGAAEGSGLHSLVPWPPSPYRFSLISGFRTLPFSRRVLKRGLRPAV